MAEYRDVEPLKQMVEFKMYLEQFAKSSSFLNAYISGIDAVMEEIDKLPIADVQEVRHGKWESTELMYENGCTRCSECKTEYYVGDLEEICGDTLPTYCPHCGARMDGENMDKRYIKELLAKQCHDTGDCKQLKRLPCPDVVEVVRCKDCVYYETGKDYTPYCNHINGLDEAKDNDFCSYGERKRW